MTAPQHGGLTAERWAEFSYDQQILMIANEMHRAGKLLAPADAARLRGSYERVLHLADLTARVARRAAVRRELLRWRGLVAALYVAPAPEPSAHAAAQRVLLQLSGPASVQLRHLAPSANAVSPPTPPEIVRPASGAPVAPLAELLDELRSDRDAR